MPIDGVAAAKTLRGFAPLAKYGHCLEYVWLAMKAHGAVSARSYPTAYSAWQATTKRHTDRNPPAGVPVWWGRRTRDGNMAGDVVISVGGGRVVATDQPTWGQVSECTIAEREALLGREYLGWSEDFLGNEISLPTAASDDTPVKAGDDDMAVEGIYKRFWKGQPVGKKHFLWLNKAHAVTVAVGPTHVFGGTVYLRLHPTTRGKSTSVYVVQAYVETVVNKKVTKSVGLGAHEIIPTSGDTFAQVPVPGVGLGKKGRLRFRIHATDGLEAKVVNGIFRAQQVKG